MLGMRYLVAKVTGLLGSSCQNSSSADSSDCNCGGNDVVSSWTSVSPCSCDCFLLRSCALVCPGFEESKFVEGDMALVLKRVFWRCLLPLTGNGIGCARLVIRQYVVVSLRLFTGVDGIGKPFSVNKQLRQSVRWSSISPLSINQEKKAFHDI